jgi:hypothetical protein
MRKACTTGLANGSRNVDDHRTRSRQVSPSNSADVISFPATKEGESSNARLPAVASRTVRGHRSPMDISIDILIAFRRTCAFGLVAGIVVALGYMAGNAVLTPVLWIEPPGALGNTFSRSC